MLRHECLHDFRGLRCREALEEKFRVGLGLYLVGLGGFRQREEHGAVVSIMEGKYSEKIDVQQLADTANMSVSAFHKTFKEVTANSPLQYLKKIRLSRARDLIVQKNMKAYLAADAVGYESPSQFSREFKRHYGLSPAEMMRELKSA